MIPATEGAGAREMGFGSGGTAGGRMCEKNRRKVLTNERGSVRIPLVAESDSTYRGVEQSGSSSGS